MIDTGRRAAAVLAGVIAIAGVGLGAVARAGVDIGAGRDVPSALGAALGALREEPRLAQPVLAAPLAQPLGTTRRVSVASDGSQAKGNSGGVNSILAGARPNQAISADGRWVAFISDANLDPNGTNVAGGVFLHDRQAGTTVSIPFAGGPWPANVIAAEPSISADGGVVAFTVVFGFTTLQLDQVAPSSPTPYVLVWDRQSGQTQVASVDAKGQAVPGWQPSVSADGRFIAYTSISAPTATPSPTPIPDTSAPSVSSPTANPTTIVAYCSTATSTTISVNATDPDDAVEGATLYYWPPGTFGNPAALPTPVTMTHQSGDLWTGTITADPKWADGQVVYAVQARDTHGNYSALMYPSSSNDVYSSYFCIQ